MICKMYKGNEITLVLVLTVISSPVFAATGTIPWTGWLLIITSISLVAAFILSKRNKSEEAIAVKLIFGGMYFWVATFIQLIMLSLVYQLSN